MIRLAPVMAALAGSSLLLTGCASGPSSASREAASETALLAEFEGLEPEQIVAAGDQAAQQGEADRALFIYLQALQLEETPDIYYRIGRVHGLMGQKSLAWSAYAKALKLDEEHAASHEELGLLYMSVTQPDSAKLHFRRAIELDPQRWRSHNALGVMADASRDYVSAIQHYEAALDHNPESAQLLNNLGYSHYLAGNYGEAEKYFRVAVGQDRNYKPAMANLGLVHARRKDYEAAVETLRQVMRQAQAYNDVGYIAYRNDDLDEAAWLLTEAIRLSPTHYETARSNLRKVRDAMTELEPAPELAASAAPANNQVEAPAASQAPAPVAIEPGVPAAIEAPAPVATAEQPARPRPRPAVDFREVQPPSLTVRVAGRLGAKVVGYLRAGDRVEVLHEADGWAFVSFLREIDDREQTGWVNSRYLATTAAPKPGAAAAAN